MIQQQLSGYDATAVTADAAGVFSNIKVVRNEQFFKFKILFAMRT